MSELKPCPFCGGEAELYSELNVKMVFCKNDFGCPASNEGSYNKTDQDAIENWNNRVTGK